MDIGADVMRLFVVAPSPHGSENHLGGAGLPGVLGQEGEKGEFLSREFDPIASQASLFVYEVEIEITDGDQGARMWLAVDVAMAHRSANPGLELCHAEGLRDVIVGPSVESRHLAVLASAGRQDDDRDIAPLADSLAHGQSVDVRKTEIKHDHIGRVESALGHPLFSIHRGNHFMATGAQTDAERTQQRRIVVDDEYLGHLLLPPAAVTCRKRHGEHEPGTTVGPFLDPYLFVVRFDERLGDRQAETTASPSVEPDESA